MKNALHLNYNQIKLNFIEIVSKEKDFHLLSRTDQQIQGEKHLDQVFESISQFVLPDQKQIILNQLLTEVVWGLQSIQEYQDDPEVEEIMINGFDGVFIKKRMNDQFELTDSKLDREELSIIIERLLEGSGRRVDRSMPIVDTRIADGSRVNVVVEPISPQGPLITIRKFPEEVYSPNDLIDFGMFPKSVGEFLAEAVHLKANILISGGTATGKTTLTSAILSWVPGGEKGERVVLIEETAELATPRNLLNLVRLETRPPNVDGKGELTIRDLVKNALRMRPDRIIVGEARGGEAYDLLQAMNTGHPGSMSTIHANSPESAVNRLESLVLLAGFQELPLSVIRSWIISSIDLFIQLKRDERHHRVISKICSFSTSGKLNTLYEIDQKDFSISNMKTTKFFNSLKEKH
ncbi:MAG: ATPase, T2SS/T4P/T4SS family [Patescibacteria group bacterium]